MQRKINQNLKKSDCGKCDLEKKTTVDHDNLFKLFLSRLVWEGM